MKLSKAFDPIEVGEIDYFAFDFTRDMGSADIIAVQWSCWLTPFSGGTDPNPAVRVPAGDFPPQYKLAVRMGDGSLQYKTGYFAVAPVGPMPASAAGATYGLGATAFLDDGRQIKINSILPCVLHGQ